jgi:hypothetical protein
MLEARNSIKNSALLRNITALKPKIDCETCWLAKVQMEERFVTLHPFLLQIIEDPNSTLTSGGQKMSFPTIQYQFHTVLMYVRILVFLTVFSSLKIRLSKISYLEKYNFTGQSTEK